MKLSFTSLYLIFLLGLAAGTTHATTQHDLTDPNVLAQVDGVAFPTASVDLMLRVLSQQDEDLTRSRLISGMIENYLFAREAEQQFSIQQIWTTTRVGYPAEVTIEQQFVTLLRSAFNKPLEHTVTNMGGNLQSLFTQAPSIESKRYDALALLQDKLVYRLTPEQQQLAQKTIVASYRLPSGEQGDISYWSLYSRENVQGRTKLHQGNVEYLYQLAQRRLQQLFIQDWARHSAGLSKAEYAALENMVRDKFIKLRYLQLKGLWSDIHDDNFALKDVAEQVTQAEINQYYRNHKDEFKQVEQVIAYHIQTESEQDAIEALKALEAGMATQQAVQQYSIAADRQQQDPGLIGPLQRRQGNSNWLFSVAFILPEGQWSRPLRSPQTKNSKVVWELVKVVQRTEGYEPMESETVRYLASRKIATEKINNEFRDTKRRLFEDAQIHLNPNLLEPLNQAATMKESEPRLPAGEVSDA